MRDRTRHGAKRFEWLVKKGFFVGVGLGRYEPTGKGWAADLRFSSWQPRPRSR